MPSASVVRVRSRPRHGATWGRWTYDERALVLCYHDDAGRWLYEIDLERIRDGAELLDWVAQVAGKRWASEADLGHLVRALGELADGIQAHFCGLGVNRRFDLAASLRAG